MACKERLERDSKSRSVFKLLKRLLTKDLKLNPVAWRRWFQSVLDKALATYKPLGFKLRQRESGLARTLHVELPHESHIDIDLAAVLEHCFNQLPANVPCREWFDELLRQVTPWLLLQAQYDGKWIMVLKPHEDDSTIWRINFPEAEKKLMKNRGCMKPTIRLMKALREKQQWPLSSYSMKSLVVQHMRENQERVYWDNENQWTLSFTLPRCVVPKLKRKSSISQRITGLCNRSLRNFVTSSILLGQASVLCSITI
ncbi:hypothetical protein MTO96_012221 [Rhipicephalus appendiculatus]